MDAYIIEVYTQVAVVILIGYALFAFAVAFFNQSKVAVRWGFSLALGALLLGSGCVAYPPPVSWEGGVARMPSGENSCGPDALAKYLELTQGITLTQGEVFGLQEEARKIEAIPDNVIGTSMQGLMVACTNVSYRVPLYSSEQVIDALRASPVLLRLPVFVEGRMIPQWRVEPRWNTQFWPHKGDRGEADHLIVCLGYKGGVFKLMNNQGPCWGSNGCIWLWEAHLDKWLRSGEASAWVVY